jgi:hypothetical protein
MTCSVLRRQASQPDADRPLWQLKTELERAQIPRQSIGTGWSLVHWLAIAFPRKNPARLSPRGGSRALAFCRFTCASGDRCDDIYQQARPTPLVSGCSAATCPAVPTVLLAFPIAKYMTYPEPGGQTKRRLQCFAALPRSVCKVLLASAQIQSDNSVHTLEDGPACGIAAASDVNHLFASEH